MYGTCFIIFLFDGVLGLSQKDILFGETTYADGYWFKTYAKLLYRYIYIYIYI